MQPVEEISEFVNSLLTPPFKAHQISKEQYKAISRKVVKKVRLAVWARGPSSDTIAGDRLKLGFRGGGGPFKPMCQASQAGTANCTNLYSRKVCEMLRAVIGQP